MGNKLLGWNGCTNVFCFSKRIRPFGSHSASQPWPCTCWVPGATLSCTNPVIGRGVHLVQHQVLPCKLVPLPLGFLHQQILKGTARKDVQGPTQPSPALALRSAFETLFSMVAMLWSRHSNMNQPILASGQWSNLSALYIIHLGITGPEEFGLLLCSSI